jgi:NAD(P)-dependent dehydrogenase (short-subunit alcohol dehydrogenase family)
MGRAIAIDLTSRSSIASALREVVLRFGGFDILVNTAAIYPTPDPAGTASEDVWAQTLHVNVTGNHVLVEEAAAILREQNLAASIVLTSSANAVVPKRGSEAYDVSKAAVSHLIRELAVGLGPLIRVNGIAPATVVAGSAMFPRHRVIDSLRKYAIAFDETLSTEALRTKLAEFYAARTITKRRFCRATARTRSAGWPGTAAPPRPATSFRSTEDCPMPSSADQDRIVAALDRLHIELPSWGFANTGRVSGSTCSLPRP